MKKIFTLIAATVLTVASFAADRRPVVTLKSSRNYEIVIDGRSYFSNSGIMNLSNIMKGQHTIKVYETTRGRGFGLMFGKAKRLVDASTFLLRNNDIDIAIDKSGFLKTGLAMTREVAIGMMTMVVTEAETSKQRIYCFNRPGTTGRFFLFFSRINFLTSLLFVN